MGALTTTAIIAEYKAYYLNSGQNLSRLKMLLRFGMETDKICTPIVTDDTIYQMGLVKTKSLVQSFQKAWTPKGEMVFTPNKNIIKFLIRLFDYFIPDFYLLRNRFIFCL